MPPTDISNQVRAICMRLPEVTERPSHGSPAFFIGKQFVMLWPDGHHGHDFPHLWCAAPAGAQDELVAASPGRFFRPPYVGARGWVGVRLDGELDWDEVAELCEDAYRVVAPARLVRLLDQSCARPKDFRSLPPGVRLDETIASVEPDPAPDPDAGRNVDQHRALRDD